MLEIRRLLSEIKDIPETHIQRYLDISVKKEYPSDSYFLKEGEKSNCVGFVVSGICRSMYATEVRDYTISFYSEEDFIGNCIAAMHKDVSKYSIQFLENSVIVEIDYDEWVTPFANEKWWKDALLMFREHELSIMEQREKEMHIMTSKEKYLAFISRYSNLENRIKQHIIATYLGITPVSLSRIRNQIHNTLEGRPK